MSTTHQKKSNSTRDWQPSCTIDVLKKRAVFLKTIREFFEAREILEVQTPVLSQTTTPDFHIESLETQVTTQGEKDARYYLQTSPEHHMKRLLAAGSGSIYQITPVFRDGECGRRHNPEFTMLEWYRVGADHHDLMQEVESFFENLLGVGPEARLSYYELFEKYCDLTLKTATEVDFAERARTFGYETQTPMTLMQWRHYLLSHVK